MAMSTGSVGPVYVAVIVIIIITIVIIIIIMMKIHSMGSMHDRTNHNFPYTRHCIKNYLKQWYRRDCQLSG